MAFIDQWNKKHGDPKRGLVIGDSPTGDLSLYDRWVLSQNPKLKNKIIQHYAVQNGLKQSEAAKLQAQQAEADKQQAYNDSFAGKAKSVGNKVKGVGEALYQGVASDFGTLGTGVGTAVGTAGGDVAKADQAQTSTIDRNLKLLEQVNAQLKDPKTPGAKKIRLQKVAKMLNEQTQQITSTQTSDAQKTLDATVPSKNVGALVNVGMLASGGVLARSVGVGEGLRAAEMTGQQILKNAFVGASEGAIGGVATGVQKDGYTQNDLLKSAGIGAGIGAAIPLLATGIGKEVSHFRGGSKVAAETPQVSQEAVATITDNQHLLPEHAGTGTIESFKNSATIDARDPALAVLQKGADPKNIKRLKVVEKKIAQALQVAKTDGLRDVPIADFKNTDTTSWNEAIQNVNKGELSKTNGPVEVVLTKNGYKLVEGNHRAVQALNNGDTTIKAKIISKEGLDEIAKRDGPHIKMGMQDSYTQKQLDAHFSTPAPQVGKTTETPKTVKVFIKSKFRDGGGYADVPVIRKEENITLYQGTNAGDNRQFWTPNKKYAGQFGEVKEKTGTFYQIDNGNRMTDVYVEAPSTTAPQVGKTDPLESLKQEARKYKSAADYQYTTGDPKIDAQIKQVAEMSPDEYLKQAFEATDGKLGGSYDSWLKSNAQDAMVAKRYAEAMQNGDKFPIAYIDKAMGSQDGRNRALAAKLAGRDKMPVGIIPEMTTAEKIAFAEAQIKKYPEKSYLGNKYRRELTDLYNQATQSQQVGGVTPDEARGLLDERTQLLESIRNPQTPIGKAISEVDTKLSTATSKQEVASLTKEKTFLQEQAVADARASSIAEDLSPSVSSTQAVDGVPVYGTGKLTPNQQSLKTEALAVKNGITEVAGDPRLTPSGSHEQWTTKVLATMNQDYEQAKKIATGLAPPPEGVPPNAFYRGVEARAIRENDGATIKALLDGPLGATSKAQGQNISALAMKDSESPLDMMKTVINARKKSNLNIPKTISNEEAQTITQLSNDLAKAREAVANGADRNLYGIAHANLYEYTNALTEAAGKKTLKEALSHPLQSAVKVAGVSKSLRATLDNSGLLRQGWKVLTTHPTTWAKNSVKSFEDLVRAFGDRNVMKEIHADVVSRPNAMNGLYKRMGIDVFGITEEAFPSSFPEKIPIFRRFYNASDAAYTGFLQRSRADLADKYLEIAAKSGVDLSSKKELQAIGKMVNSLTSRGHLGPAGEKASTVLNNVFFSPRMLKSNIDVLGGQVITGAGGSNFVRKRAAMNLVKMVMSAGAVLKLADAMKPGSVEWDPKSSNFGKVKVGDTRFDVTGGMSGLVTLAVRQAKRETKSSTTGIVSKLDTGEPFSQSSWDSAFDFLENKYSPAAAVIRDWRKGEDFNGNKPTVGSTIQNLIEPLIITNYQELKDNPRSANLLAGMIAEGLGVSVNTYSINSNWDQSTGKTLKGFKKSVGDRKFKEANTKYNESFNSWFDQVRKSDQFSKLGMEDRKQLITDKRTALQKDIMNSYGFQYKPMSKDEETKRLINDLKNMKQ